MPFLCEKSTEDAAAFSSRAIAVPASFSAPISERANITHVRLLPYVSDTGYSVRPQRRKGFFPTRALFPARRIHSQAAWLVVLNSPSAANNSSGGRRKRNKTTKNVREPKQKGRKIRDKNPHKYEKQKSNRIGEICYWASG